MSDIKKSQGHHVALVANPNLSVPIFKLISSSGVASRSVRVAILVGEGVDTATINTIYSELLSSGVVPYLVGCKSGETYISDNMNTEFYIDARPPILFEAVVIPDGDLFIREIENNTVVLDFLRQQYHHCTPILAIGIAHRLLAKSDVFTSLPSGLPDPTILVSNSAQLKRTLAVFKAMLPATTPP